MTANGNVITYMIKVDYGDNVVVEEFRNSDNEQEIRDYVDKLVDRNRMQRIYVNGELWVDVGIGTNFYYNNGEGSDA